MKYAHIILLAELLFDKEEYAESSKNYHETLAALSALDSTKTDNAASKIRKACDLKERNRYREASILLQKTAYELLPNFESGPRSSRAIEALQRLSTRFSKFR